MSIEIANEQESNIGFKGRAWSQNAQNSDVI